MGASAHQQSLGTAKCLPKNTVLSEVLEGVELKTTANGLELVFALSPGETRNSTEARIVKM